MDREVLDQWCERGILGLALAMLVFLPLAFGGQPQTPSGVALDFLLANPFTFAEWLMIPLLGLWLARLSLAPKPRLLWTPLCWAVLAFAVYAAARYWTADIEYISRLEVLEILVYALFFFAVVNNLHKQETVQVITFTLLFLAMLISFYAIYQFLRASDQVWHEI